MKIKNSSKTEVVLNEIGVRLTQQRIQAKLTQAGLAEKAGVSKRTIERIEAGSSIQLSTMLQVLRVFKLLEPFGLALTAEKNDAPSKKKSKSERVETPPPAEAASKSHSWGY
ncbi:MAG: helix-turn-helix domain-containing protein [Candidatus Marinimicrobia bacterium]|jgi:transcriptional regulator with XRE-family HTH domain|nr:helix-turn-helix domain-containing protein [Candidatus Neomarinimicrobiota bacterium]MBT3630177.1 helix-turn-helix domain-containing protein [Candidatus Neomarinimicrobiota bacterium]MBT3826129.1 helix-turn-helix domain-containing protein [Candidatus Neomarinimicrobiota bacterium]MBT4132163.1 helix-turn-helix domain-containing protein [Candidatus Neomarinimicrobiota bacterium]MBT4296650.1 helix-turn-helix domain-containing protein [Candidatus Neomarinimicrobiota bacterium]